MPYERTATFIHASEQDLHCGAVGRAGRIGRRRKEGRVCGERRQKGFPPTSEVDPSYLFL